MKNISILGLGNISYELCSLLIKAGFNVFGSTDNSVRKKNLKNIGVRVYTRNNIAECISKADKLIITIPPNNFGCKIINNYSKEIIKSKIKWIGYLSSTSVYGNYDGKKVNEQSILKPKELAAQFRVKAEKDIEEFGKKYSISVEIFRLAGIYGNNRNIINNILSKKIKPIFKEGHYFNRIHEKDIARVLCLACSKKMNSGIINLSDNLPAPQLDVIKFAFSIMNKKMPKPVNYLDIIEDMSPKVIQFWENNRRVDNSLLKNKYGNLLYPTYKEGLKYIYECETLQSSNRD
ncbi:MAG: hypothetical protein CMJ12_02040 [Pelagibacterales bacterium]|nr:hypothetical protein [Pelagibacterales bacterium]PPR16722.1 MAG: hypothetical protein CFH33_00468 [Alphaproteobacteria bacterium MarineAlpha9_Bin3]|tara:strand:- start:150 stop:1022 length:873 start_codon:yes stop_codon:yes gene_type:complete